MKKVSGENGNNHVVDVIIPAYNEAGSISLVLGDIPKDKVREIIVCNNGSTDQTAQKAADAGAKVLSLREKGYGIACLTGIEYLKSKPREDQPDIIVFMDADYSDHPEQLPEIIAPIRQEAYDLVIGSRVLGRLEKGAMQPQQVFGNWLATTLIRMIYGYHFTDLGPFRAIRWTSLLSLGMEDRNYGWTVEMQVKAAKKRLRCTEVPVDYRKRIGKSKVSGTIKGSILAGHKILWTIFKLI